MDTKFFMYKNKPLVRCKNTIYYGDIKNKFVIKIEIKNFNNNNKINISNKLTVQLLSTNFNMDIKRRIIKLSEKEGLYSALEIADIWLERALAV